MQPVRTAVIGAGYLGRFHAQKYALLPESQLVAVADVKEDAREQVAAESGCRAIADYRSVLDEVDAVGASVFSTGLDIANSSVRYASGCVANTTASRFKLKTERKLRLLQDDAYVSIDLQQKILTIVLKPRPGSDAVPGQVVIEERSYQQGDALKLEIAEFLRSIREGRPPVVSGDDGLVALETAIRITELVQASGGVR
jgi:predicted dehydrogenase